MWSEPDCEELVGDEMVGFKERRTPNDGHLYGHQGVIVKSHILCNPLVMLAHQTGLEPVTY